MEKMYTMLKTGTDLYNKVTEQYVFLYSENGAICVYDIDNKDATELAIRTQETKEYWSTELGRGGWIYDATDDAGIDAETAEQYCNDHFPEGEWMTTDEYANLVC